MSGAFDRATCSTARHFLWCHVYSADFRTLRTLYATSLQPVAQCLRLNAPFLRLGSATR
jgi:hypothetical protein